MSLIGLFYIEAETFLIYLIRYLMLWEEFKISKIPYSLLHCIYLDIHWVAFIIIHFKNAIRLKRNCTMHHCLHLTFCIARDFHFLPTNHTRSCVIVMGRKGSSHARSIVIRRFYHMTLKRQVDFFMTIIPPIFL